MRRHLCALLLPVLAYFVGCSTPCDGVSVNGRCEPACHDEACPKGSRCVDNACSAICGSCSDCSPAQECLQRVSDQGAPGAYCVKRSAEGPTSGGGPCTASADCAECFGYRCVGGSCTLTCDVHSQCGAAGSCTGSAKDTEGRALQTCEKDLFPRGAGQYGTMCPKGTECDKKQDFLCVGAGVADIDAYCTRRFCANDDECPSGSFCQTVQSKAPPCEDACGLTGSGTADCVAASDVGVGKHFTCGPAALLTNVCRHREFCTPCSTDADCRGKQGQLCAADESGEKICTVLCDPDVNSCPWGNAGGCGVWDRALGRATCSHRFGSCHGSGKSCEPCVDQGDCPGGICTAAPYTGERYCIDLGVSCSCPAGTDASCAGGGCPRSPEPAALEMSCLGGTAYDGSVLAGRCLASSADPTLSAGHESCWPHH